MCEHVQNGEKVRSKNTQKYLFSMDTGAYKFCKCKNKGSLMSTYKK